MWGSGMRSTSIFKTFAIFAFRPLSVRPADDVLASLRSGVRIKPIAERRIDRLPPGPLFWRIVETEDGAEQDSQPETEDLVDVASDNLLDRLLYWGVLPRYAFPTDVAPFYCPGEDWLECRVFEPSITADIGYSRLCERAGSSNLNAVRRLSGFRFANRPDSVPGRKSQSGTNSDADAPLKI